MNTIVHGFLLGIGLVLGILLIVVLLRLVGVNPPFP